MFSFLPVPMYLQCTYLTAVYCKRFAFNVVGDFDRSMFNQIYKQIKYGSIEDGKTIPSNKDQHLQCLIPTRQHTVS